MLFPHRIVGGIMGEEFVSYIRKQGGDDVFGIGQPGENWKAVKSIRFHGN